MFYRLLWRNKCVMYNFFNIRNHNLLDICFDILHVNYMGVFFLSSPPPPKKKLSIKNLFWRFWTNFYFISNYHRFSSEQILFHLRCYLLQIFQCHKYIHCTLSYPGADYLVCRLSEHESFFNLSSICVIKLRTINVYKQKSVWGKFILALRNISKTSKNYRLSDKTVYTNIQ
jgi:hypothetical protein